MSTVTTLQAYPFDPKGRKASNRVTNDRQILSGVNYQDFYFIVPKFAPYFKDSLKLVFRSEDGVVRPLIEDVDFYCSHKFIAASAACTEPVFGSISFNNTDLKGIVTLEYQTVGGDWVLDDKGILEVLANKLENPRITSWDVVANVPYIFPPVDHDWDLVDQVGLKELVDAVDGIAEAVMNFEFDKTDIVNATNAALDAAAKAQAAVDNLANLAAKWSLISGMPKSISDLATQGERDPVAMLALAEHLAAMDPHSQYATDEELRDAIALAKKELTDRMTEKVITIDVTAAVTVIDLSLGTSFIVNMLRPTTFSFTKAPPAGTMFSWAIKTINDATAGRPLGFQAGTKFAGGFLPPRTLDAFAEDIWTFFTDSAGQTNYGSLAIADAR